ncbi:MAG: thioredoxin fold domain-containing protein [Balneolaceae bacterium]
MKLKLLPTVSIFLLFAGSLFAQVDDVDVYELDEALELAQSNNKKILINVYAEWCPYCEKMHKNTYTDEAVIAAIDDNFYLVMINIESENSVDYLGNEMSEIEFAQSLNSDSLPTSFFMNSEGEILGKQPGLVPAETFYKLLNFVGTDAYLSTSFQEFSQSR